MRYVLPVRNMLGYWAARYLREAIKLDDRAYGTKPRTGNASSQLTASVVSLAAV